MDALHELIIVHCNTISKEGVLTHASFIKHKIQSNPI